MKKQCGFLLLYVVVAVLLLPLLLTILCGGLGQELPQEAQVLYGLADLAPLDTELEEYVAGVVAAEMPADFEEEALKADFEFAEELASHGVGLKHDVWNVVPNSIFFKQTTPSLDYYVKLTKGFYEIMQKYGISTEMDNYRKCSMHASINLDRI